MKNYVVKMNSLYYSRRKEHTFAKIFSLLFSVVLFSLFFQSAVYAETTREDLETYRMQGLEAQKKGLLDDAIANYTKALSLDPNRADIYNDLGVVYEAQGNAYEARRYYFDAINLDKKYLPAYSNLAFLCKRQGNLAKAAEYFKRRIELGDPADPWTKEAVEQLRILAETFPQEKRWLAEYETNLLERRAVVLEEKLKEHQDQVLADRLSKADNYIRSAQAYEQQQMYAQALAEYDRALSETPESPRIIEYRRLALLKLRKSEIEKLVSTALEKFEAGDNNSSKEDFRQILTIIPDE